MPDYKHLVEIEYSKEGLQKNSSQKIVRPEQEVSEVESKVKTILCTVLKKEEISLEQKLVEDLKADSLDAISIVLKLEKEFNMKIPREDSKELKEVQDIINYIARKQAQ